MVVSPSTKLRYHKHQDIGSGVLLVWYALMNDPELGRVPALCARWPSLSEQAAAICAARLAIKLPSVSIIGKCWLGSSLRGHVEGIRRLRNSSVLTYKNGRPSCSSCVGRYLSIDAKLQATRPEESRPSHQSESPREQKKKALQKVDHPIKIIPNLSLA